MDGGYASRVTFHLTYRSVIVRHQSVAAVGASGHNNNNTPTLVRSFKSCHVTIMQLGWAIFTYNYVILPHWSLVGQRFARELTIADHDTHSFDRHSPFLNGA